VKSGHFCWITKDEIAHFRKMGGKSFPALARAVPRGGWAGSMMIRLIIILLVIQPLINVRLLSNGSKSSY